MHGFLSLLYGALHIDAPIHLLYLAMRGETEKEIRKIKFRNETCSKFGPLCILEQDASLRKYIGTGIPHLSLFCRFLYLHSFSYLRLPISTVHRPPNLHLPRILCLPCHLHLPHHLHLLYKKISQNWGRTICCVLPIHGDIV